MLKYFYSRYFLASAHAPYEYSYRTSMSHLIEMTTLIQTKQMWGFLTFRNDPNIRAIFKIHTLFKENKEQHRTAKEEVKAFSSLFSGTNHSNNDC